MQTVSGVHITLLGPEDDCRDLALRLLAHTIGPTLKSKRRSFAINDCVQCFLTETSPNGRQILSAMFNDLVRYKGVVMLSTEDALNFTRSFPDLLLKVVKESNVDFSKRGRSFQVNSMSNVLLIP